MEHDLNCPTWANRRYKVVAFDLWQYYSWRRYESCIRMRIDFDEHLDEALLAEAFEQSCVTFPLIACTFDTPPLIRPRWVPRREAAREILQVIETQGEEHRDEDIYRAFANVPSIKEGPQLRAFLVRSSTRDSLCLIANHMLCDTAGFKEYVSVLARLYSRIARGLDPSPAPFDSRRGIQTTLKGLGLKDWLLTPFINFYPNKNKTIDLQAPVGLAFESGPFSLPSRSVPAEDFKPLRAAATSLGFTVNTLFLAALALAWHRVCDIDRFHLPCTMDARRLVPSDIKRGITNLSNTCPCVIRITPDDMMEDIMAKFSEEMKAYRHRLLSASQFIQWAVPLAFAPWRWVKQRSFDKILHYPLTATNLGIIDEDCVRFGTVSVRSAHLAAAVTNLPAFVVGLSTFRGEITVSSSIEGDEAAKDFIYAVLAAMREELMAFGTRHSMADGSEVRYGV
jgi:NRPS condensation-like uncharacterized protein